MTDEERNIITSVCNDMVLRNKLEDDPYNVTSEELYVLENNDRLNENIALLVKDALVKSAITNNERFFSH
jgi:hypothetical protein